jgi:hypothetical protein
MRSSVHGIRTQHLGQSYTQTFIDVLAEFSGYGTLHSQPMFTLATIAAVAVTGMIIVARWMMGRFSGTRALRDVTVSRDWLVRHHAQDRS